MPQENNTYRSFHNDLINEISGFKFKRDFKEEYSELKNFYLNDSKKKKLENMSSVKRFFFQLLYLFQSIFEKLTPFRRILVFFGLLLLFVNIGSEKNDQSLFDDAFWGGLVIFFVLVLELKDKLLAVEELVAGRKIQKALMPEECPDINGWNLFLFTTSANEVSGDLVDYLKASDEKISITIADVAGKGLSAALLTAKLQATVRAFADISSSPAELTSKTNHIFNRDSLPNIFASMIYIEISPGSNKINFANAGHLPPLILTNDHITELEKGDAALGLFAKGSYRNFEFDLASDQIFVAYSDGVTEAVNETNQFFGKENLFNLIRNSKDNDVEKLGRRIIFAVDQFRGEAKISDDLSLVILKKRVTQNIS